MKVGLKGEWIRGGRGFTAVSIAGPRRYALPDGKGKAKRQDHRDSYCSRCGEVRDHVFDYHRKRCQWCGHTEWVEKKRYE